MPTGRKGKFEYWLTDAGLLTIEGWARDGLKDEQIAQKMGIASSTFYEWSNRFAEMSEALKKGKAPVDIQVENALLKRALGYTYEETIEEADSNGKKHKRVITKHMAPDVTAQIIWLKNRRPDKWRDKPVPDSVDDKQLAKAKELLGGVESAID